jgi:hypothetical protein
MVTERETADPELEFTLSGGSKEKRLLRSESTYNGAQAINGNGSPFFITTCQLMAPRRICVLASNGRDRFL